MTKSKKSAETLPIELLHDDERWNERAAWLRAHPEINTDTFPWTKGQLRHAKLNSEWFNRPVHDVLDDFMHEMMEDWLEPPDDEANII